MTNKITFLHVPSTDDKNISKSENHPLQFNTGEPLDSFPTSLATALISHPRQQDFKATPLRRTLKESQELRRQKALERQREHRRNFVDLVRKLALFESDIEGETDERDEASEDDSHEQIKGSEKRKHDSDDETMEEIGSVVKRRKQKGQFRRKSPYANQIMYAEWMTEVPKDLAENWLVVICPIGKRCFVTSANGKTISRLRNGSILDTFPSYLPAGSRSYGANCTTDYCILDCIFDSAHNIYYVLDLMCWKGHPIYECETEFRFYWLQTKLSELERPNASNDLYKFIPLLSFDSSRQQLSLLIQNPNQCGYDPDGFLFFNKYTQYVLETTPLVCWVGMEKVHEILAEEIDSIKEIEMM